MLNINNWAEYIGENTVKNFEKETGIKVRYDDFESNEVLLAKVTAGQTGYDIVIPSSDFGRIMIDGGKVQKLDPGNQYMVPWLGGLVSVGYNVAKVKSRAWHRAYPSQFFWFGI